MKSTCAVIAILVLGACAATPTKSAGPNESAGYLYIWASTARGSFLGTFDIARNQLTHIALADTPSRGAHHTEYALTRHGLLYANAFGPGRTFLFDVKTAAAPKVVTAFGDVGPFSHPHSYARLANGHVIATFQHKTDGRLPGGLVELDEKGKPVRWASAATSEVDSTQVVPYSLVVVPKLDRIVMTSTHMTEDIGVHVQIWRLSDLKLLRTLPVPAAVIHEGHGAHDSTHHRLPGEPRVLADGKTVMFGTFTCGLYHIAGLDTNDPTVVFTAAFPGADCALPVVIGKYWLQTVPALRAVVALDVTDPARPVETSRVVYGDSVAPHWLGADEAGRRLVMSSSSRTDPTLYMLDFDPMKGTLSKRGAAPVLDMRRVTWPDGSEVSAVPHGVVFSR